jgi:hypothetical protein
MAHLSPLTYTIISIHMIETNAHRQSGALRRGTAATVSRMPSSAVPRDRGFYTERSCWIYGAHPASGSTRAHASIMAPRLPRAYIAGLEYATD